MAYIIELHAWHPAHYAYTSLSDSSVSQTSDKAQATIFETRNAAEKIQRRILPNFQAEVVSLEPESIFPESIFTKDW